MKIGIIINALEGTSVPRLMPCKQRDLELLSVQHLKY